VNEKHHSLTLDVLTFGVDSLAFHFVVQKFKDQNMQNCLYGCKTWSLTLRVELRLRGFENGVLRRIFAHKGEEITEEWGNYIPCNKELKDLYSSPNVVRVINREE
jgi:hypothetical protein